MDLIFAPIQVETEDYQSLQSHINWLHKLQQAYDMLRRVPRFLTLAHRLKLQMAELNGPLDISVDVPTDPLKSAIIYEELANVALTIAELSW